MNSDIRIVKVGGAVVEDDASLRSLLAQFAALDCPRVLVHGGGRSATRLAERLGLETRMVAGRRVTDAEMLAVVTMVYGGLVNKTVVARLQAMGVNALGLTGADLNIIRSHRRPLRMVDGEQVDYGFVGDIDSADGARLLRLLADGIAPVLAPLSHDGAGSMLNVNADTIAATAAIALATEGAEVTLTYCFEKPGVLANPDDDSSVIPLITPASFSQLVADGTISGGMLPKIENALDALRRGVSRVLITSAADIRGERGTVIANS